MRVIIAITKKVNNSMKQTKINLAFTISFLVTGSSIEYAISFDLYMIGMIEIFQDRKRIPQQELDNLV